MWCAHAGPRRNAQSHVQANLTTHSMENAQKRKLPSKWQKLLTPSSWAAAAADSPPPIRTRIYYTNSKKLLLPAKNPARTNVSKGIARQAAVVAMLANGKRTFVMLKQKNTKLYLTAPRTPRAQFCSHCQQSAKLIAKGSSDIIYIYTYTYIYMYI